MRSRLLLAAVLDVVVVVAFVAIGRREHDESSAARDLIVTAAPFLFGLVAAWFAARLWRAPTSPVTGLLMWPAVMLVGMLTRRWVFGDGTALAFVIVATAFVGAGLVGWRALATFAYSRRR